MELSFGHSHPSLLLTKQGVNEIKSSMGKISDFDNSVNELKIIADKALKSEIVVPLFVNGVNIGQIDIDSHVLDPFTAADERFLEFVNQEVSKLF